MLILLFNKKQHCCQVIFSQGPLDQVRKKAADLFIADTNEAQDYQYE